MKELFKDLDLYKVIILASLVLLPIVGFWAWSLEGQLEDANAKITAATKKGGHIEEIGEFQQAIETQRRRQIQGGLEDDTPQLYFWKRFVEAQKDNPAGQQIKSTDVKIEEQKPESAGRNEQDRIVDISFVPRNRGEPFTLSRSFLMAVLFNCEANRNIWKLREFEMRNASWRPKSSGRTPPPPELGDEWEVTKLSFARREPKP